MPNKRPYTNLERKKNRNQKIKKNADPTTKGRATTPAAVDVQTRRIIRGDYCQADRNRFGDNAGKQCTAIATTACIASTIINVGQWSNDNINTILNIGNDLYCWSVREDNPLRLNIQEHYQYLAIEEVVRQVNIFGEQVTFHIDVNLSVAGHLLFSFEEESIPNLLNALNTFFVDYEYGVVTSNQTSIAVIKGPTSDYYYFDSHSLDANGQSSDNGCACIIACDTIEELNRTILNNLYRNGYIPDHETNLYNLTPVIVITTHTLEPSLRQTVVNEIPDREYLYSGIMPKLRVALATTTNVVRHQLGEMSKICPYCDAKFFKTENQHCCGDGKVVLEHIGPYPQLIVNLISGEHIYSENFVQNIMQFNNMFAFASVGAKEIHHTGVGLGSMYIIQGNIQHRVSNLYPTNNPMYGHLYIIDSAEATTVRSRNNRQCSRILIGEMDELLREINPYARIYLSVREVILLNIYIYI